MTARKKRSNVDETIENIQPPPPSLNGIKLKSCYRTTDTTVYKCHYCPQQFLLKYNLVDHEFIHVLNQDKPISGRANSIPMKVPASIKTKNATKHIRSQHSNSNPFECEQCDMTFGTKNHLDQHRYVHRVKGVWPCSLCKMQFHSESQLNNHKRIHTWIVSLETHFPFDVNDSNVNFQSVQTDAIASNANHATSASASKWSNAHRTATATCINVASKKNAMEMVDIISISSDSLSQAPPPVKTNNAKAKAKTRPKCDECNQSFCDITKLRRHQLNHSGVRNFKCKRCKKIFYREDTLKSHEKLHQNQENKLGWMFAMPSERESRKEQELKGENSWPTF